MYFPEQLSNHIQNYGWCRAMANRKTAHPRVLRKEMRHLCPKCGRTFTWRYNLQHHLKYACGQLPRFNCPYCAYRTKHTSNVRAHVRRKHPDREVYVVDLMSVQHWAKHEALYVDEISVIAHRSPNFNKNHPYLTNTRSFIEKSLRTCRFLRTCIVCLLIS